MRWWLAALATLVVALFAWTWAQAEVEASAANAAHAMPQPAPAAGEVRRREGEDGAPERVSAPPATPLAEGGEPLPAPARLAYRVQVVDPETQPIEGARLLDREPPLTTDANGLVEVLAEPGEWLAFAKSGCVQGGAYTARASREVRVVLRPALHLRVVVRGSADVHALHARVILPANAKPGPYVQGKYEQTPGIGVDGTRARWVSVPKATNGPGPTTFEHYWELGFDDAGRATLDHVEFEGEATVELRWFDRVLDARLAPFPTRRGVVEVVFERSTPVQRLRAVVVDDGGRPVVGARVQAMPYGTVHHPVGDAHANALAFPVWAPSAESDGHGAVELPMPPGDDARLVITSPLHAARAVTIAAWRAANGRLVLQPARTVHMEIVDREGQPVPWPSGTGGSAGVEVLVHLGHDVYRRGHRIADGTFACDGLPPGPVEFWCLSERWTHDARLATARHGLDMRSGDIDLDK